MHYVTVEQDSSLYKFNVTEIEEETIKQWNEIFQQRRVMFKKKSLDEVCRLYPCLDCPDGYVLVNIVSESYRLFS